MENAEREKLFGADKLEDMCEKRSEEYQSIKAHYEAWCVDQQQKLQTDTEELEHELIQLKKKLSDVDLEDSRATEELRQLLSRPRMHRGGSPDIQELFAEADKWNSELRRIRADRDRPREYKDSILRDIEKAQIKLEGLPAAYALLRKEETRRTRGKLEHIWQQQGQSDSLATSLANYDAQGGTELLPGTSHSAAEDFSLARNVHEQRNERSREASLEIINSMEFRQSRLPSRASSPSLPGRPCVRSAIANSGPSPAKRPNGIPNSRRTSGGPMTTSQHRLSQPSSNAAVFFRDRPGRHQAERATRGLKPQWTAPQETPDPAPSPAASRFGHVDTSFLPNIQAEARRTNGQSTRANRRELPRPDDRKNIGKQAKMRHRSQVSSSDSESDVPLAKRHKKDEKTIRFDQVNAEGKDWNRGREKIYRITEYPSGSNKWYIFPCEKHCTGLAHAEAAARHLERGGHRFARWTPSQAAKELGVRVIDCDREKQEWNNHVFDRAREQGYRSNKRCNDQDCPLHGTIDGPHSDSNLGQRQQSEDLEDSESGLDGVFFDMPKGPRGDTRAAEVWQQPNLSPNVLDPIPGALYQAYWPSERCWYPVTVLPLGDLSEVGLVGSLDETDLFKEKLPTCFATEGSHAGLRIVRWKSDFELHGRRASERKFPCMFFEGFSAVLPRDEESPQPAQNLAWIMAKHLRHIDYRHPDDQRFNEAGLDEAKAFSERVIVLKSKAAREPSGLSQLLVDDDSDVFHVSEKPLRKYSKQLKDVKTEPDLDDWV